jgi:diketogulonate reductase-like aldo/keto reductase
VPLPKSDDPTRIHENADIYDFELSHEDMEALNGLDQGPAGAMDEDAWAVADMKKPA